MHKHLLVKLLRDEFKNNEMFNRKNWKIFFLSLTVAAIVPLGMTSAQSESSLPRSCGNKGLSPEAKQNCGECEAKYGHTGYKAGGDCLPC